MVSDMIKKTGQKVVQFCVQNACYVLPYPDRETRARLLKNSALFAYVLVLLFFQIYLYNASPQILGFATNIKVDELYSLVNQERAEAGLPALKRNSKLENAAYKKAQDMFSKNYWAHYAPDGSTTPWQFITESGYGYKYAGENLAKDFDTSSGVVSGWMASSSHKANLVNTNYKDLGMVAVNGVLLGEETTLVVQMLAAPVSTTTATTSPPPPQPSPTTAGTQSEPKPEPEPKPIAVTGPSEEGSDPQSAELAAVGISPVQLISQVINPITSPKTIPLGFGFFLMGLFALDEVAMFRGGLTKSELKRTAENVGHMAILGLLMVLVWLTRAGGVL